MEEEPLKNIVNKLARFHNVQIDITNDSLANVTFGGQLEYKDSIVKTLETIGATLDFDLSVTEHRIIISKK